MRGLIEGGRETGKGGGAYECCGQEDEGEGEDVGERGHGGWVLRREMGVLGSEVGEGCCM